MSGAQNLPEKILGIYASEEKAIQRCLREPSYSTFKWLQEKTQKNYWHNNLGLYVKVKDYTVE